MFYKLYELFETAKWRFSVPSNMKLIEEKTKVTFISIDENNYKMTNCYNPVIQVLPQLLTIDFTLTKVGEELIIQC